MFKRKIIVVLGPTASGKSKIAFDLAKNFNGFLISADSRQVYKHMDIGTNKDKGVWREGKYYVGGVEECLTDVVDPDGAYSLENWLRDAKEVIMSHPDNLPIIVGGTGLYVSALVDNYELPGTFDCRLRKKLEAEAKDKGLRYLIAKMKKIDPDIEQKIDVNNPRRVVRSLEILLETKKPMERNSGASEYDFLLLGISLPREKLYKKINARVDQMIADGLIEEVKKLIVGGYDCSSPAMTGIGYRQICRFLNSEISREAAIELIKRDTRRYAKRQLTWFRRDKRILWVVDFGEAISAVEKFLTD